MSKMSAFSVDTGRQTTPPLVSGVVHNRLVQPTMTHLLRHFISNILVKLLLNENVANDVISKYMPCFVHILPVSAVHIIMLM